MMTSNLDVTFELVNCVAEKVIINSNLFRSSYQGCAIFQSIYIGSHSTSLILPLSRITMSISRIIPPYIQII